MSFIEKHGNTTFIYISAKWLVLTATLIGFILGMIMGLGLGTIISNAVSNL